MERYQATCQEVEHKFLEDEEAHKQRLEDERRNQERNERDGVLASSSRNLDDDFMEIVGHKVYNTPYSNVFALATELANT
jgi:hypothetical protein